MTQNIIITMEGGNVTAVLSTGKPVNVTIIDYDNEMSDMEDQDAVKTLPGEGGHGGSETVQAYVYQGIKESRRVNTPYFNQLWKAANGTEPEVSGPLAELYPGISDQYDCFEIHPVHKIGENAWEQCSAEEAEMWSVYVHLKLGGLQCIADCNTEQDAEKMVEFLKQLNANKPGGDYLETYYEMVSQLETLKNQPGNQVADVYDHGGTGSMYEMAEEWTDEFQREHEGKQWNGEFFDAVDRFVENKLANK